MPASLLVRLPPDIMLAIMQQLEFPTTLHNLLAADPDLEPLYACYQQSIDNAIDRNIAAALVDSMRRTMDAIGALYSTLDYPLQA
jgi:molybdopterin-guanine dinucleotide biosynthesis protein A